MHQSKIFLGLIWQKLILFAGVLAASWALVFFRLNKPPLLNVQEVNTYNNSHSLHYIFHHPLNAPYYLIEHCLSQYQHSLVFARSTSALIGIVIILLLFFILKFWLGINYAVVGSIVFACSSWFLHIARFNSPNIMLLLVLAPLACGIWLKHSLRRKTALLVGSIVLGLVFYVPGLIWFLLAGIIVQRRTIIHEIKHTANWVPIAASLLFIVIVSPLGWSFIQHPLTLKLLIGVPAGIDWNWGLLLNLARVPEEIFVRGPLIRANWLGRVPILDIFEIVMLGLGIHTFWQNRKLDRTRVLVVGLILGLGLITINGASELTIILPFLYVLVAAGLVYMWDIWHSVFPTNPVAKTAGLLILGGAIVFSGAYHLREYFEAWPNSPQANSAYTQKLPEI